MKFQYGDIVQHSADNSVGKVLGTEAGMYVILFEDGFKQVCGGRYLSLVTDYPADGYLNR
jgi:hypothetical protein